MKYNFKHYQNRMYQDNYVRNLYFKIGFALSIPTLILIIGVL